MSQNHFVIGSESKLRDHRDRGSMVESGSDRANAGTDAT